MPESLPSPQMLGNAPAHNILTSNAAGDLIRQILQQQQLQHQQATAAAAAVLQLHQQHQAHQKHPISDARSSTSSPENHDRNEGISSSVDDEDTRPGSVGSSSPQSPPPSSSRSSSRGNNPNNIRPQRKLKIYGVDEKLDIIDYAKIIGNRAAGREYNVAESSIREWRKNEAKLRYVLSPSF